MDEKIRIPLLTSEDIEVKPKQVTKTGAIALLYKTARVDRKILNEVFGIMNWTSDFKVINDTLFCGIGIRQSQDDPFVWKWEAGGESDNSLDDGAAAKAETSDAFKRAGFAVGIGEELYSSPRIFLNVETVQKGDKWFLKNPYAKYVVTKIEYNESTRMITALEICNAESNVCVYSWELPTTGAMRKKLVKTLGEPEVEATAEASAPAEQPTEKTEKVEGLPELPFDAEGVTVKKTSKPEEKKPLADIVSAIGEKAKQMKISGTFDKYKAIVTEIAGADFKCNAATEEQYDIVYQIYKKLNEDN